MSNVFCKAPEEKSIVVKPGEGQFQCLGYLEFYSGGTWLDSFVTWRSCFSCSGYI